jgi:hypothetical protein
MSPQQLLAYALLTGIALGYLACWAVHRIGGGR